jgi:hypothetical protein
MENDILRDFIEKAIPIVLGLVFLFMNFLLFPAAEKKLREPNQRSLTFLLVRAYMALFKAVVVIVYMLAWLIPTGLVIWLIYEMIFGRTSYGPGI